MIVLCILGIVFLIGIVRFLFVKKEALERFEEYKVMAKVADTSYGKVSYIDEG